MKRIGLSTSPLFFYIYYMKLRNEPIRKGKTIQPNQLNKIYIDFDIQELFNDFENNNIQNALLI